MRAILLTVFFVLLGTSTALAECRQFIELWSASVVAKEMGTTESWVVGNYKINIWAKTSEHGKYPKAGELLPGSRALLLDTSSQDFKVKSPYDGSTGWVNQIQVKGFFMLDDKTFKLCK